MKKTLLIMRHAKSDWGFSGITDFERPLNARGKKDAPRMGQWLVEQQYYPDSILASPARRAQETVESVCATLQISTERILWCPEIYNAPASILLEVLKKIPTHAKITLLVGHNPGIEQLIPLLCNTSQPAQDISMPTAAIAQFYYTGEVFPDEATVLQQIVCPKDFPY